MSKAKGKVRNTRYTDYQRWVGLLHFMLRSLAWAGRDHDVAPLPPDAQALLIAVWQRYNGSNNGEIGFSVREAARICGSKDRAARAFAELIDRGFLRVARHSSFTLKTREARTWTVTALPIDDEKATLDFMRWSPGMHSQNGEPKNKTQSHHKDRQSHHKDRGADFETKEPLTVAPQGPWGPDSGLPQSHHKDTSN